MKKLLLILFFVILLQINSTNASFSPSSYYIYPVEEKNSDKYLKEYEKEYFWEWKLLKDYSWTERDSIIDEIFSQMDATTIYINTLKYKIKLTKSEEEKKKLIQINNDYTDRLVAIYKLLGENQWNCYNDEDKACLNTQRYHSRNKPISTVKTREEWNAEIKELFTKTWNVYNLYVKNQDKFILTSNKEIDLWDLDTELDGFVSSIKSVNANLKYSDKEKENKKQEYKNLYFNELKPAIKESEINNFSNFLDNEISLITKNSQASKLLKREYYYLSETFRNNLSKKIEKVALETRTLYIWKLINQVSNAIVKSTNSEKRKVYRELKKFLQKELNKTLEILGKL